MKKTLLAIAVSAAISPVAFADQKASGLNLSAMLTEYNFSRDSIVEDDETGYSLGVGYKFDSPWGVELMYVNADTEVGSTDVDVDQIRLDGLYHVDVDDARGTPYVAFGAGQKEVDGSDEPIFNVGVGVKFDIASGLAARFDYRIIHGLYSDANDNAVSLGLAYQFGGSSKPAPAPAPKPAAPADSDGDGVIDANDRCPNSPAGVQVDSQGCERDDDNDGVVNSKDQCPNTRAGAKVDAQGCYETLQEDVTVSLEVKFANNSSEVPAADMAEVKEVADFMKQYPQTDVVIEGHTDDRGRASYNASLSERRAKAVAQVLVERFGIENSRVSAIGYGEERPLVSNDTAEGRAQNRRVTAVIKATVEKIVE